MAGDNTLCHEVSDLVCDKHRGSTNSNCNRNGKFYFESSDLLETRFSLGKLSEMMKPK
jgi:hypothetical protein